MSVNTLSLPNYKILNIQETKYDYVINTIVDASSILCPHCNSKNTFQKFGAKNQTFMDLPIDKKYVCIIVNRQRYRCKECKGTFYENLPHIDKKRSMTKRLVQYIENQCINKTFLSLSKEVGVDEKTIRNIFKDHINHL